MYEEVFYAMAYVEKTTVFDGEWEHVPVGVQQPIAEFTTEAAAVAYVSDLADDYLKANPYVDHPEYSHADLVKDVVNDVTRLGYWDWIKEMEYDGSCRVCGLGDLDHRGKCKRCGEDN